MNRGEVARVLKEISGLMRLRGDEPFRVRAIENAARQIERASEDPADLARTGRLTEIPGVGATVSSIVCELCETGRSSMHEALAKEVPPGLPELLRIPGLGASRVHRLYAELGIEALDDLEEALRDGRVAELRGFGSRTVESIVEGVHFLREVAGRTQFPFALEDALALRERLRGLPDVFRVEIAGEVRRCTEVVGRVDLIVSASDPDEAILHAERLGVFPAPVRVEAGSASFTFASGVAGRARAVPPERFAPVWTWETGSEAHREALATRASGQGLELGPEGLLRDGGAVPVADEEELYRTLGLPWIPPELREGLDEIDRAAEDALPSLVTGDDLRGAFHCHSDWSDGKATLEEMASAARDRGWSYLGIADHSRAAAYANGLSVERVRAQQAEIDRINDGRGGFRLLKGIESDILADGALDYDTAVLRSFDYVVGSIHSGFTMERGAMTERLLRAVRDPHLTMLGHPTGRLLLRRSGYDLDLRRVLAEAIEHGVVIEINANPWRLDLDWREVRWAAERGAFFAVNPDAHSAGELVNVAFGINVARKGGLEADRIVNTWPLDRVEAFLAERRAGAERTE